LREETAKIVEGKLFRTFVLILILFNTIVLCLENIIEQDTVNKWLKLLSFIFLLEISLKMMALGLRG
jgi:hypothetical protein